MIAFTVDAVDDWNEPDDFEKPLDRFYSERRLAQFRRVLLTSEVMRGFRFGQTLAEVRRAVAERAGETYCARTTHRDLQFLQDAGLVERQKRWGSPAVWRWIGGHQQELVTMRAIGMPSLATSVMKVYKLSSDGKLPASALAVIEAAGKGGDA